MQTIMLVTTVLIIQNLTLQVEEKKQTACNNLQRMMVHNSIFTIPARIHKSLHTTMEYLCPSQDNNKTFKEILS